jgi:type II pantothenate kinase
MSDPVPFPALVLDGYRATTFAYDPESERASSAWVASRAPPGTRLPGRAEWVAVFRASIPEFRKRAASDARVRDAAALADRFAADFDAKLDAVLAGAHEALFEGAPTVLKLCKLRDECLRRLGFEDCFLDVKTAENARAAAALPSVLAEIDAIAEPAARVLQLVRGAFAGNIFDLGASKSAALFADGGGTFHDVRDRELKPRPWCVDDFDAFAARWLAAGSRESDEGQRSAAAADPKPVSEAAPRTKTTPLASPWRKCVVFVDNAGADVALGMLPFARELARGGCAVVLAANAVASINDITAAELEAFLERVAGFDPVVREAVEGGRLRVVSSGSDLPVIDLSATSRALSEAAAGCDLVVLEGMGRAIETNLAARFTCDALNVGMVTHPEVALCLGGALYDCVCRFRKAGE